MHLQAVWLALHCLMSYSYEPGLFYARFSSYSCYLCCASGKARRLKQAKEEAQAEVDAYRKERERQYQEHEKKVRAWHTLVFYVLPHKNRTVLPPRD